MDKTAKFDILEAMLYTAAPLAGQKELDEYKTSPAAEFSEKAQNKIYKKLCKEQKYYSKHEKYSPVRESFKRAAIVILAVMSISFTCVLSIDAAREAIWNAIIEWSEQFFCFKYTSEIKEPEVPTVIKEYKEPIMAEKFERREVRKTERIYTIQYEYNDILIVYRQLTLDKYDMNLSNFETKLTEIFVNGNPGIKSEEIFDTEKNHTILWNDGIYAYEIFGNIEFEKLLIIAESIE